MPALGGLAMAVFVIVLGADLATRDSGEGQSSATAFMEAKSERSAVMLDQSVEAGSPDALAPGPAGAIAADTAATPGAEAAAGFGRWRGRQQQPTAVRRLRWRCAQRRLLARSRAGTGRDAQRR